MGLQGDNLDVLKRSFPVFRRSTKRISNFVQDMLSFSKARAPMREEAQLAAIIKDAHETFTDIFERKKIDVTVDTNAVNGPIFVDPKSIYRCMLNLLTNAADAVPVVGGQIRIVARSQRENVKINITDNGLGVPEEYRKKIFDPFFSTKGAQGTGLGLAVTQKIVQEHGGTLTVMDLPDGGAHFRVLLPANAPPKTDSIPT